MTPELALRWHVLGSTAVTNLIADRFAPFFSSQEAGFPRVIYSRSSTLHERNMKGAAGLVFVTFEIEIFADSFSSLLATDQALRNRLDGFRGTVTSGADTAFIQQIHIDDEHDNYINPTDGSDKGIFARFIMLEMSIAETTPSLT